MNTIKTVYRYEHYSSKIYGRALFYRKGSRDLKPCKLYAAAADDDDDDRVLCTVDLEAV